MWEAELAWLQERLERMPWQEALWAHRRAMLCAPPGLGADGQSSALRRRLSAERAMVKAFEQKRALGSDEQMASARRLLHSHLRWCDAIEGRVAEPRAAQTPNHPGSGRRELLRL